MENRHESLSETSAKVFNLNIRGPYIADDMDCNDFFAYEDNQAEKPGEIFSHSLENTNEFRASSNLSNLNAESVEEISNLYHECSGIDSGDIPNLSHEWVEQEFKDADIEQSNLFVEPRLYNFEKD